MDKKLSSVGARSTQTIFLYGSTSPWQILDPPTAERRNEDEIRDISSLTHKPIIYNLKQFHATTISAMFSKQHPPPRDQV